MSQFFNFFLIFVSSFHLSIYFKVLTTSTVILVLIDTRGQLKIGATDSQLYCSPSKDAAPVVDARVNNSRDHDQQDGSQLERLRAQYILYIQQTTRGNYREEPLSFYEVQREQVADSNESMAGRLEPRGNIFRSFICWFKERARKSRRMRRATQYPIDRVIDQRVAASRRGPQGSIVAPAPFESPQQVSPVH